MVCFVKLPMRVEMQGRLLPDGCFLICDPWNILLELNKRLEKNHHLFSFWKIVYKFENGLIYWNLEIMFQNLNNHKIYNNNISISSSLVFSFGKLGRPRGMTLGTRLFSFLISLTKSPNQKQSQLHEFRSKLSILCILTFSIEQFLIYLFEFSLKNHGNMQIHFGDGWICANL
ncbi:hypothetical protein ACJX0J_009791 [Zea mays]